MTARRYSALSTRQHHSLWALLTRAYADADLHRFALTCGDGVPGVVLGFDSEEDARAWHAALAGALAALGLPPAPEPDRGNPTTPKPARERGWRTRGRSLCRDPDLAAAADGPPSPPPRLNSASQLEADLTRTLSAAAEAAGRAARGPPGVVVDAAPLTSAAAPHPPSDPVGLTPWYTEDGVTVYVGRDADGDDVLVESFVARAPPRLCASTLLRSEVGGGTAFGPDPPRLLRVVDAHTQYLGVRWRPAGLLGGLIAAPRDLILRRTWRREDDGQYVVLYTSASDADAFGAVQGGGGGGGGMRPAVRGRVVSSGYTFAPLLPEYDPARACGETLVTHVAKLDAGGCVGALRSGGPLGRALAAPAWGALLLPLARRSIALKNAAEAERFVARPFLAGSRSGTRPPDGVAAGGDADGAAAARRAASLAHTRSIFRRTSSPPPPGPPPAATVPASPARPPPARGDAADAGGTMLRHFWWCPGAAGFKVGRGSGGEGGAEGTWSTRHGHPPLAPSSPRLQVRGPTYLDDHRKIDAGEPMLSLAAVDLLDLDAPCFDVARFLPSIASSPSPFLFVVNLMIPGPTPHSVVISWAADRAAPGVGGAGSGMLSRAESVRQPGGGPAPPPSSSAAATTPFASAAGSIAGDDDNSGDGASPFDVALARFLAGGDGPDAARARDGTFKLIPRITEGSWIVKQSVGTTPCLLGHKLAQR